MKSEEVIDLTDANSFIISNCIHNSLQVDDSISDTDLTFYKNTDESIYIMIALKNASPSKLRVVVIN